MFVLVLAAEADETRQAVTLLIVCLVGIAVMLAVLTVWYWLFTSPKRRSDRLLNDLGHYAAGQPAAVAPAAAAASTTATSTDAPTATATAMAPAGAGAEPDQLHSGRDDLGFGELASPKILIDSSDLMSSTLADSNESTDEPGSTATVAEPRPPSRPDLRVSAAPKTVRRADSKPAEGPNKLRPVGPADRGDSHAPVNPDRRIDMAARPAAGAASRSQADATVGRIEVAARPSMERSAAAKRSAQDELAKARHRKARQRLDEEGLSDDDWAAVMKSAYNHLNR